MDNYAKDDSFRWAVGIEGSCIPHLEVDQYEWTQHDKNWREDFKKAAKDLSCRWMRYSLVWHCIETSPGIFDWSWADERIQYARELGLNLIVDLVHFGTPTWLPEAFGDIDFPVALERFATEFGKRYSGVIRSVCPLNEPLITALFCGDVGLWPPHGRSMGAYMTVLSRVGQGITRAIGALRKTMSSVEIVLCDALEFTCAEAECHKVASPELLKLIENDAVLRNHRRHIVLDLIMGRVGPKHELYSWLEKHSFPAADLKWFSRNPVEIDVLGLDYYKHSEIELYPAGDRYRQRVPKSLSGLRKTVRDYWQRYGVPIMITETNCYGNDEERLDWLKFTVEDIRVLRGEGIPVIGYTWWPLFDHLDWDGALLHRIGRIHNVGIYRLERRGSELARVKTPLVDQYANLIRQGATAVGEVAVTKQPPTTEQQSMREKHTVEKKLNYPIIVHCHLRWDGVWQRPQQFLSRLSENHRILFVEGPKLVEEDIAPYYELKPADKHSNITIMRTYFPAARFSDGTWVDSERLRLLEEALQDELSGKFECPVQWFYDPMAVFFAHKLNDRAVVYDCMDQLSQFKFAPPELIVRERELLHAADVVFAGGRKLWQAKSKENSNCHFYGCGVDVPHFSQARDAETAIPTDVNFVHRPILGYFGVVDERLDYDLITKLADANREWSIVIIGPTAKVDPNALPCRENIYWLGRREYATLPCYTKAFDVCLMPFALNEATEYINPTKALEYMASGKPIVSTAVPDVISNFGDVVKIAQSPEEFINLCRESISSPQASVEKGLEMAGRNSWDSIVENLEKHVGDALKAKAAGRHPRKTEIALSAA